jgi:molybdopterin molybdotransferase
VLPTTGVDEALAALLSQVDTLAPRSHTLETALGLVLAEPMVANESHPADDKSAMDGYAVYSKDLKAASADNPVLLQLQEDIKAGSPPTRSLSSGQTSRISTGGLVPQGADAVVMREVVEVTDAGIRFGDKAGTGQNIRYAGEHLLVGEKVVSPGLPLGPAEIGMAAFLGKEQLQAIPRVTVAVLSTGSELVRSGVPLKRGQIRDSNGISLASALRAMGCEVTMQTRVPDRPEALDAALEEAFSKSKVVLTSGGISVGWHDLVRQRIEKMGGKFSFHKLRMRPGKPLAFGHCGDSHFFCLPGNPVSTMVTFEVFAKPALRKMAGLSPHPRTLRARLTERIEKREGFTIFYRGFLESVSDGYTVRLTGPQGSHMLKSMVEANVLVRTEEDARVLEPGTLVTVVPLKEIS